MPSTKSQLPEAVVEFHLSAFFAVIGQGETEADQIADAESKLNVRYKIRGRRTEALEPIATEITPLEDWYGDIDG
jgi:hypothetical protein